MSDGPNAKPSRRRGLWWKLTLGAMALVLFLIVLAHAIWRGKEREEVAKRVAAIRARGEPIEVADLVEPSVPDGQNVVPLIRAAIAVRRTNADRDERRRELERLDDHAFELPLTGVERAILREQADENATAIEALRGASNRPGVAWGDVLTSPLLLRNDRDYIAVRAIANLLGDAATLAIDEGRDADAIAALRELPALSRAMAGKRGLVGYLVGVGIDALRSERLLALAQTINADPATRGDAERLIAELCDDAPVRAAARAGFLGERVSMHDAMGAIVRGAMGPGGAVAGAGGPGTGLTRYVMSPMFYAGDAKMLDYAEEALRQLSATSEVEFKARSARMRTIRMEAQTNYTTMFASILMPSLDRALTMQFRSMTDRHIAATALAVRLYQLDHAGERPATLGALVPKYLPALPIDAIDGQPLRYEPRRAILWGVGENGKDDGGDATPKRPGWTDRWQTPDAVVFLDRRPRPATQPIDGKTP